ncbi:MAG: cysteine desulfurase family protein [Bacteroidota bacterium]
MIYFDNAASTPIYDEVNEYMYSIQKEIFGNPSAIHSYGRKAKVEIERSRKTIAECLKVQASEIFFTSGGTEANNAILWGCAKDLGRKTFITSPTEHPCVLKTLESLVKHLDIDVHFVDVDSSGSIDLEHLRVLLQTHKNAVVSLMHANNEIGVLLQMEKISKLCQTYGALFHSDIVQTAGKYPLDMNKLGVDFAAASAHKFHGPKGVGFMFVKSSSIFNAFINGGAQERNMRAGTENIAGICGMTKALEISCERFDDNYKLISSLKKDLIYLLQKEIPGIVINGNVADDASLYTLVNISLPNNFKSEMLLANLDIEGVAISMGSACSSGANKGSHVLTAIGADPDRPALRVSFSHINTKSEVEIFVSVLKKFM